MAKKIFGANTLEEARCIAAGMAKKIFGATGQDALARCARWPGGLDIFCPDHNTDIPERTV
jgi:hypothetical protein